MSPSTLDSNPSKKSKPRTAATEQEFPRGVNQASIPPHMAATLPWPTSIHAPILAPLDLRLQLPPLLQSPFTTASTPLIYPHNLPASPTSQTSTSTSVSQSSNQPPPSHSQAFRPPGSRTSPTQPRHERGKDISFPPPSASKQGLKRPYGSLGLHRPPEPPQKPSTYSQSKVDEIATMSNAPLPMPPRMADSVVDRFPPSTLPKERFTLHLRQQPRAARAGPDGKDRRTIDPPPVLQLLIDDFDAANDVPFLKAHDWVVHTKLISAEQPQEDVNSIRPQSEGQSQDKITRLLLGTTVSSPFFCADDPDPDYAPKHPSTKPTPPPSPTMRIIKVSRDAASARKEAEAHKKFPGAYFIFADLSVRKAGQYRLEFRLMKMEPSALVTNSFVPTISVAVSDIFNVVNAKDFDQVQPSTNLVKGLIDRGAGFPLKLKKGLREGQRRKNRPDVDDDGDDDDPDDHENRDDAGDEDIEEEDE